MNPKLKKALTIVIPLVLAIIIIPLSVWGVSRMQLKSEEKKMISGTWEEVNWDSSQKFEPENEELYHTIDIDSSKPFTLLTMSDIHYRNGGWFGTWALNGENKKTDKDIASLKEQAKPDLIIVTGDIETGSLNDLNYKSFVKVMDEIGVPWTIAFGNHDSEHRADKPAIMNILQESKTCIFRQGPTNLGMTKEEVVDESVYDEKISSQAGGLGNTVINLRDKETGEIIYAFVLMDTGDWQNMYQNMLNKNRLETGPRPFSRVGVGLTNRQIEWYKWVIDGLTAYNKAKGFDTPETMFLCHIGMKSLDYATILSQYENSWGGKYTEGTFENNDLPFHTEAEWSRPADRWYTEYDGSDEKITGNDAIMNRVKEFGENAKEKEGNDAISQYWLLANKSNREKYLAGENESFPNPKHISELIPIIDKAYAVHKANDLFIKAVYDKNSTKRIVTGHNHCDGYEVEFDGITYTSVVKTGDIYVDRESDMENRGGAMFTITKTADGVNVVSKALYTRFNNYKSTAYPRPVEEW